MADEDEIDVLGDFSFNSCFALNNQGIPSCSSREDTVHPQWLLDSTETNWYDKQSIRSGPSRRLIGDKSVLKNDLHVHTSWTPIERKILVVEMAKYGRNIKKLSQAIKTKTEAEIQALIDAEYGIHIEPLSESFIKYDDQEDIPSVVQEEIVADTSIKKRVVINLPESLSKHPFRKRTYSKQKNRLLKHQNDIKTEFTNPAEIFYEDDLIIGSTQSIGSELDATDVVSKNIAKYQAKVKAEKKIGNHRRKVSQSYDKKPRNKSKDLLKSPQGRHRKDSSLSDDSVKSPKMQIVLGSGQALPVSEGEEVIKIEKKKDSEPESDIEIDVDSESEVGTREEASPRQEEIGKVPEEPIAVPLRRFEPMPRRQKKINLDGEGGFTIMHTEAGDMYEVGTEPKKERQSKKQPVHLIRCRVYNAEKPAPYIIRVCVSCLILMDAHAHTSRGEVMGLAGGSVEGRVLTVRAYRSAKAAAGSTHCDMDPVSQSTAAEAISELGLSVCGWHHSHPQFPCAPSAQDLTTQRTLQQTLEWGTVPLLGVITSQHWAPGRHATQYRCLRVEDDPSSPDIPIGYQFSVKLLPDISEDSLPYFLDELRTVLRVDNGKELTVDMVKDVCPQANITYLEKCISSVSHHMRSAGYPDGDAIPAQVIQGLRDVFR